MDLLPQLDGLDEFLTPELVPTLSPDGQTIYIGSNQMLHAISAVDGVSKWTALVGGGVSLLSLSTVLLPPNRTDHGIN